LTIRVAALECPVTARQLGQKPEKARGLSCELLQKVFSGATKVDVRLNTCHAAFLGTGIQKMCLVVCNFGLEVYYKRNSSYPIREIGCHQMNFVQKARKTNDVQQDNFDIGLDFYSCHGKGRLGGRRRQVGGSSPADSK